MINSIREYVEELHNIKQVLEIDKYDSSELEELCYNLGGTDFCIELNGCEYRFIHENGIENIFAESIQDMIEDCYDLDSLPNIISSNIDWEGIVKDCEMDGYGHHFSGYNGSEENVASYYIFRTN